MVHGSFSTEVTIKIFIDNVSLMSLWSLHSVEHKADIKKDEKKLDIFNGHQVRSTVLIIIFRS